MQLRVVLLSRLALLISSVGRSTSVSQCGTCPAAVELYSSAACGLAMDALAVPSLPEECGERTLRVHACHVMPAPRPCLLMDSLGVNVPGWREARGGLCVSTIYDRHEHGFGVWVAGCAGGGWVAWRGRRRQGMAWLRCGDARYRAARASLCVCRSTHTRCCLDPYEYGVKMLRLHWFTHKHEC